MFERNAPVKGFGPFLGSGYRLLHVAEEDAACRKHLDVHHTKHLAGLDMCSHLYTMSRTAVVAVYRVVGLHNAHDLCHDIAGTPRRTSKIGVGIVAFERAVRTYLVEGLGLASNYSRLVYLTCYPGIEIAIFKRNKLAIAVGDDGNT